MGSPSRHHEAGFDIAGLQVRTNNTREASPDGLIGRQWQRLYGEGLLGKIPHRADDDVLALYTDYASDENGDYTYILGARVTSCVDLPQEFTCRHVPAADHVAVVSEKGAIPGIVIRLWQRIWNSTPEQLGGTRSFRDDYELYDARASDRDHAQIEIHVGVK